MLVAILLAGGISQRLKGIDKRDLPYNGTTVIEHVVNRFLSYQDIDRIYLVTDKKHRSLFKENKKLFFADPGSTRTKSIKSAMDLIDFDGYVLVHDVARPFFSDELIERCLNVLKEDKSFVTAVKSTDTIKFSDGKKVIKTLNRDEIYQAQTPQGTRIDILKRGLNLNIEGTDDSYLVETLGEEVYIVDGEYSNTKITNLEDLRWLLE